MMELRNDCFTRLLIYTMNQYTFPYSIHNQCNCEKWPEFKRWLQNYRGPHNRSLLHTTGAQLVVGLSGPITE